MNRTTTLSAEQRQKFDRDGYLVLEDIGVSEDVIDSIVSRSRPHLQGRHRAVNRRAWTRLRIGRILQAFLVNDNIKRLAVNPTSSRRSRSSTAASRSRSRRSTSARHAAGPHSDAIHFNSDPPGFMCGVWVALEDIDMDNGPLVYYPGSHKLPEVHDGGLGLRAGEEEYSRLRGTSTEQIEREGSSRSTARSRRARR